MNVLGLLLKFFPLNALVILWHGIIFTHELVEAIVPALFLVVFVHSHHVEELSELLFLGFDFLLGHLLLALIVTSLFTTLLVVSHLESTGAFRMSRPRAWNAIVTLWLGDLQVDLAGVDVGSHEVF